MLGVSQESQIHTDPDYTLLIFSTVTSEVSPSTRGSHKINHQLNGRKGNRTQEVLLRRTVRDTGEGCFSTQHTHGSRSEPETPSEPLTSIHCGAGDRRR